MQYFYRFGWYFGSTSYLPGEAASRWEPVVGRNTKSQKTPLKARARDSKPLIQLHKTAENSRGRPGRSHVGPTPPRPGHSLPAAPALCTSALYRVAADEKMTNLGKRRRNRAPVVPNCLYGCTKLKKTLGDARGALSRPTLPRPAARPAPPAFLFFLYCSVLGSVRCTGPRRHAKL